MATTTNFGWETPDDTDLVKDGALAIRTLGSAIDTSLVDLKGGTTGQVLSKTSNTDMDFTWVTSDDANAIQNSIVDAKGDLITATANDTPSRLAVGTNGHVLTADSTTATGLKWAAPAGGGKVLQVVGSTYATQINSSSATPVDTGLSATITPSATTSKILVLVNGKAIKTNGNVDNSILLDIVRGSTTVLSTSALYTGTTVALQMFYAATYLDSPSTTSATTYKLRISSENGTSLVGFMGGNTTAVMTLLEIGA